MLKFRLTLYLNEYLNHFVAACNARASTALSELALVILRCRTDQFNRSFPPAAGRLWNLMLPDVFRGWNFKLF